MYWCLSVITQEFSRTIITLEVLRTSLNTLSTGTVSIGIEDSSVIHIVVLHDYYTFTRCIYIFPSVVYGPYWQHLKEAWEKKDNPNLHFLFYEDLKENNMEELKRLDDFLGTKLTQEQLDNVSSQAPISRLNLIRVVIILLNDCYCIKL